MKGKTVQVKPDEIKVQFLEGPKPKKHCFEYRHNVCVRVDILITVSRNIIFITATILLNRKKNTILGAIQQVIKIYKEKGHGVKDLEFVTEESRRDQSVHTILVDSKFQVLQSEIKEMGISVNVVTKNEHVPEVEHQNQVIKEQARVIIQTLPYRKLPKKYRSL